MKTTLLFVLVLFFSSLVSLADGTKQLRKETSEKSAIQLYGQEGGVGPHRKSATYEADSSQRIYFTVADFTKELVFLGFQLDSIYKDSTFFRIKDKDGNIVMPARRVPVNGTGFINNYDEAVSGPNFPGFITNPTGYSPFLFTPTHNGDYYIEFNLNHPENPTPTAQKGRHLLELFDLSVVNKIQQKVIEGRVWSRAWDFSVQSFDNVFSAKLYIYADDGIITEVDFNGMKPYAFIVSSNQTGTRNRGNALQDRQSVPGDSTFPQYKIFLTYPDTLVFKPGKLGVLVDITQLKCADNQYCLNVTTTASGYVEVLINLNGIDGYQPGTEDVLLDSNVAHAGTACLPWDGRNGLGDSITPETIFQTIVSYQKGLTHLPLYDVEGHPNGYIVKMVAPKKQLLQLFWDNSQVGGSQNLTGCTPDTILMRGCQGWGANEADAVTAQAPNEPPAFGNGKTQNTWWYATLETDTSSLSIPPLFTASILSDHPISQDTALLCPNANLGLMPDLSAANPAYIYSWQINGQHISNEKNPKLSHLQNNTKVTLLVTNTETGCKAEASYTVLVEDIIVPNLITPNMDDQNDSWEIANIFPHTHVEIYNRWGMRVYRNTDYDNSWGNKEEVSDGVYYYYLKTNEQCGAYKGWVEVLR